jgi:hypothetical protein
MSGRAERLKRLLGQRNPYKRTACISAFCLVLVSIFGLAFLLPNANASSAQAGLTVVAEILGVLLGAALVVAGLVIEQSAQAEQLLRAVLPKYRGQIQAKARIVNAARVEVLEQVKAGEIQLDDPLWVGPSGIPSRTTFRDAVSALSTLVYTFRHYQAIGRSAEVDKDLRRVGYSEDDVIRVLYVDGFEADSQAECFLRMVETALDITCIAPYSTGDAADLAQLLLEDFGRDGVDEALRQLDRSQALLGGKSFALAIILPTITIALTVLTILGATEQTVAAPGYLWIIVLIVAGFVSSLILALRLVGVMLD